MTVKAMILFLSLLMSLIRVSWFASSTEDPSVNIIQASSSKSEAAAKDFACADANRDFTVSPGKKLTISAKDGAGIRITGWDKNQVHVEASARDDDDCRIDYEQTNAGIEIHSKAYNDEGDHYLRFEISVPSHFDLDIDTAGGAVEITGVQGKIEGRTMGGALRFANLDGQVDFTTMGGEINLSDSHLDGSLETMGGKVQFRNVTGNVKGHSMGGSMSYVNTDKARGGKITDEVHMNSMGGDLEVSDAPQGAFLHTMGGEIHVENAIDHVKAETMGGDINIDSVDGWIDAKTMGGDVTARIVGNPNQGKKSASIVSFGGDIELTVPDGLPMEFDIKLAYTHRGYKIESDFPMEQEESKDWDDSNGNTPRKYIYGKGKVGSGANLIHIETINGNIRIKKG